MGRRSLLGSKSWLPEHPKTVSLFIGLATFGILATELALIRWTSGQIRIMAYFTNMVLIAAFLGMGLGVAIGRSRTQLVHWTLPCLLVLAIILACSEPLGLLHMPFPDTAISLWGADRDIGHLGEFLKALVIFMFVFVMHTLVFLFAGGAVGALFPKLKPLKAYSADLLGSLLGILAFTGLNFLDATPPVWLAVGALPILIMSRSLLSLFSFVGIIVAGFLSINGAYFSPYNRIDLESANKDRIVLSVNRDFHQIMHNLSDERINSEPADFAEPTGRSIRQVYDSPFVVNANRNRALIVGAGTGNDVQAALRAGYKSVYSNDIDRKIIEIGKKLHPEKPYSDPRVTPIINDARAFFHQYKGEPFDIVCFGLLDSHAMFSAMSSLRLDNYVYTEEGIRSAFAHVSDGGHLSLSFSVFAGTWIFDRLYWTIKKATGIEPHAFFHGMHYGATFIVPKPQAVIDYKPVQHFSTLVPSTQEKMVHTTSDDWPFLYLKPDNFPVGYLLVLALIIAFAVFSTKKAFSIRSLSKDFNPVLFLLGAAFLLIETRGITSLSLLFGSTWLVNSAVFSGILTLVLIANLLVDYFELNDWRPWMAGLILSSAFLGWFDVSSLNQFDLLVRGLIGGLITALPIGFAGLIVSILLKKAENVTVALGSNLLGSVVGGCLEYLSMFLGLSALAWLALILYLIAWLILRRTQVPTS
jgi:SAM-dependent methyltransferase